MRNKKNKRTGQCSPNLPTLKPSSFAGTSLSLAWIQHSIQNSGIREYRERTTGLKVPGAHRLLEPELFFEFNKNWANRGGMVRKI